MSDVMLARRRGAGIDPPEDFTPDAPVSQDTGIAPPADFTPDPVSPTSVSPVSQDTGITPPADFTPDQPIPTSPPQETGALSGLISGVGKAATEGRNLTTGNVFPAGPPEAPVHRSWMNQLGFGIGHSWPTVGGMIAGGALGGAAGTAIEPGIGTTIGTVGGSALGAGLTSFLQELQPAYQDARQHGLDHDAAVSQAYSMAASSGALNAATAPLFGLPVLKNQISNMLFHSFVTAPAVGAVERGAIAPAITGQPTPSAGDMASGYLQDAVTGLGFGLAHKAGPLAGEAYMRGRYGTVDGVTPTREPGTEGPAQGIIAPPEPPHQPLGLPGPKPGPTSPLVQPGPATPGVIALGPPEAAPPAPVIETPPPSLPAPAPTPIVAQAPATPLPQPEPVVPTVPAPGSTTAGQDGTPGVPVVTEPAPSPVPVTPPAEPATPPVPAPTPAVAAGTEPVPGQAPAGGDSGLTPPPGTEAAAPQPAAPTPAPTPTSAPAGDTAVPRPEVGKPETLNGREFEIAINKAGNRSYLIDGKRVDQFTWRIERDTAYRAEQKEPVPAPAPTPVVSTPAPAPPTVSTPTPTPTAVTTPTPTPVNKMNKAALVEELRQLGGFSTALKGDMPLPALRALVERTRAERAAEATSQAPPPTVSTPAPTPVAAPAPAPAAAAPTPTPSPVPTPTPPDTFGTRPVSSDEIDTLNQAVMKAQATYRRLSNDPSTPPEKLKAARAALDQAQKDRSTAKGPPIKGNYLKGDPGGTHQASHEAAVKAHEAAVNQRIHDEGTTPSPDPGNIKALFRLGGDVRVVRAKDTQGREWVGTGHAMVRDTPGVDKAATQAAKGATAKVRSPATTAVDNVTRPDPKANYETVTWHRQVTDGTGRTLVLGTVPGGQHVALQKPIYDTLHAAAGPGGTVVAASGAKADQRLFARNAKGDTVGVGQPMRVDQAVAKTWSGAPDTPAPAPAPAKTPAVTPKAKPPKKDELSDAEEHRAPNVYDAGQGSVSREDIPKEFLPETRPEQAPLEEPPAGDLPADLKDLQARIDKLQAHVETLASAKRVNRSTLGAAQAQLQKLTGNMARARAAWRTKHVTKQPGAKPAFDELKYAPGTSIYKDAFRDAGRDPELMVSRPIAEQNQVLSKLVQTKFGFSNVEVTKDADPKQTRDQLLDTYRAGMDMANALSLPYEALSLNGRIALSLRGGGRGYYGVYEPSKLMVGIVGQSQSFMHEWFHALDHMLSAQLIAHPNSDNLLSSNARGNNIIPGQHDVLDAFAKLINTMFYDERDLAMQMLKLENIALMTNSAGRPLQKALDAQAQLTRLAGGASRLHIKPSQFRTDAATMPNPQYWISAHEMLARAGEAWAARMAQNAGVDPKGLAMSDEAYGLTHDPRIQKTFPHEQERLAIFKAISDVFDTIRHAAILPPGVGARSADFGMADPSTWGRQNLVPGQSRLRKMALADVANWKNRAKQRRPLWSDPTRPSNPLALKERAADMFREHFYSSMAMMDAIIARAPKDAQPMFQELRDKLMHAPGTGRYVPQVWEEMVRQRARRTIDTYTRVMKEHGLEDMSPEEGQMLRHVLTTGSKVYPVNASMASGSPTKIIPDNIVQAEAKIRHLLDQEYDHNDKAGLDIQYARSGYFPRMFDDRAISGNQEGFKKAATELHKLIFDQDVGTPPDPAKMLEWWAEIPKEDKALASQSVVQGMTKLAKLMRGIETANAQIKVLQPGDPQHATLTAQRDQDLADAEALADQHQDEVGTMVGERAAFDWNIRVQAGGPTDFDTRGPSAAYTRGRKLPPEADRIMRDYMITSPDEAIPLYLESSARRTAFQTQFGGANGTQSLIDRNLDLAAAGGANGDDIHRMRAIIEQVTGRTRNQVSRGVVKVSNYITALAMARLLPRTAWSAVHEPIMGYLATGDFKSTLGTLARLMKNIFSQASAQETADLADYLGITTNIFSESVVTSRTTDYKEDPNLSRIMSHYYRMTGLTQITNAQRRAAVAGATDYFRRMANLASTPEQRGDSTKTLNRRDDAIRGLREYGVPDEHHADFAAWLNSFDGIPTVSDLHRTSNQGMAGLYNRATFRWVNRVNQDPMRVQKPMLSADPRGKLIFALMSFNYSFTQQVLEPAFERITHAYGRQYERSRKAGASKPSAGARATAAAFGAGFNVFTGAAAGVFAALVTAVVYTLLFNKDQWDKHEKLGDLSDFLLGTAMSRSGVAGTLDPLAQALTHLRYQTDLAQLLEGAPVTTLLKDAQDLFLSPFMPNSRGDSNTAVYNQTEAAFKLLAVPGLLYMLTKASAMFPGGLLASAAAIAAWEGTSPKAINTATSALVGERGTKDPDAAPKGEHGLLPGLAKHHGGETVLPGLDKPGHDKKAGQEGGGGGEGALLGLVDDVAMPALRALPGPLKAVGLGTAGAWAGWDWWNRASTFRNAPPPEKSQH